eukprot:scaffold462_cov195-Pinguiococcus_pyrenoidosus.AAC.8
MGRSRRVSPRDPIYRVQSARENMHPRSRNVIHANVLVHAPFGIRQYDVKPHQRRPRYKELELCELLAEEPVGQESICGEKLREQLQHQCSWRGVGRQ